MLNHNSVDAVPMADADHVSERQNPAEIETEISLGGGPAFQDLVSEARCRAHRLYAKGTRSQRKITQPTKSAYA